MVCLNDVVIASTGPIMQGYLMPLGRYENYSQIAVEEDEEIAVGDKLAVVEAMKMQTPVTSQVAGTVVEIHAKVGDTLKTGDKILKIITEVK